MKYKKGKQFESAVEMAEALGRDEVVIGRGSGALFKPQDLGAVDIVAHYSEYHQAIEEKEDEVKEFWQWAQLGDVSWHINPEFYDERYRNSSGHVNNWLKDLPDSKKRKIESSKIRINMRTLEIVEGE